ncbi:anthranilate phosphoribosyltransferase [Candidatus Venteria ishoeyi]|uniref:Anthranilate phosphoribosyltransferase n=1 Tax=Candidatus Venteria ishoeyi TaxID=1899563 RepID=A0A1H6FGN0_9GAMM|nr:anthranilate phosphoribosyltransferase [Candidatus Venteria ishoeyi]SEH08316.1 Anthranilate phosphoribosyltransferase [Candidatus Venteria ishoeyi]
MMKQALQAILEGHDFSETEMTDIMQSIMTGQASNAQIGGFLIGLRMKGETVTEITAAAKVMRQLAAPVTVTGSHVVDIVGTGGDGAHTFNISTASIFVAAAAGATVAKHGNRSVSSKSGSADVLEAAGVKLDIDTQQVADCINQTGLGFMFAPMHHSAMKHAITARKDMGVRTIFNLLGPLTNPANAPRQLLGVFSRDWVEPMAEVLRNLGSEHVLVVHSEDGLDEISLAAPTFVAELKNGEITTYTIKPEDFGLQTQALDDLIVENAAQSLELLCGVLQDRAGSARDIVQLNAGAAIYAAGLTETLAQGMEKADEVIKSGAAAVKMTDLIQFTNQ